MEHTNSHLEGGDTNSSAVKALSGEQISFKPPSPQTVHQFKASDCLSNAQFQTSIQLWHHLSFEHMQKQIMMSQYVYMYVYDWQQLKQHFKYSPALLCF